MESPEKHSQKERFRYYAFISYSRKDIKWAKWLQEKLQNYLLPANLIKDHKELPQRIAPVFRDQQDISGIVLEDALQNALASSRYLIVICSPNSARSKYVNDEIRYFCAMGRQDRIIPLIVAGEAFSPDPDKECFPEALRAIRPELLGINIREHGKRKAFLRVVSALLCVHHDEILWRDGARRTVREIAATVACLLTVMLIAGVVWSLMPHSRYYNAYITCYEVPQGIYELTDEQRHSASDCYRITTQRGKVIRLECVNSAGTVVYPEVAEDFMDYPRQEYRNFDSQGRPTEIALYDAYGTMVARKMLSYNDIANQITIDFQHPYDNLGKAMSSNMTGKLIGEEQTDRSEIIRQVNTYDENGWMIRCLYYRNTLGEPASDGYGVYGKSFTYTDRGQVETITNLDRDGNVHLYSSGYATEVFYYNQMGSVIRSEFYDPYEEKLLGTFGYGLEYELNSFNGNVLALHNVNTRGERINIFEGYSSLKLSYDERGYCTGKSYFSSQGDRVPDEDGVHMYVYTYDPLQGRVSRISYRGTMGLPVCCPDGYETLEIKRDAAGREIENLFFDGFGHPVTDAYSGSYGHRWTYDEYGYDASVTYLDADGNPMTSLLGYASACYINNANGYRLRCEYRDPQGKLVRGINNIAVIEYSYDPYGNRTGFRYLDEQEQPVCSVNGFAVVEYQYEDGNIAKESFYDEAGYPTVSADGYHACAYDYAQGNVIRETYYGADGGLICLETGYAVKEVDYDQLGWVAEVRFYDENRAPVLISEGYHKFRQEHDIYGNIIYEAYFDTAGNPLVTEEGYAAVGWDCDSQGRDTAKRYYGADGQPVACTEGYHEVRYGYDADGNVTHIAYFDTEGNPFVVGDGFASLERDYDALGRYIAERYYGVQGEPVFHAEGYFEYRWVYDEAGNPVVESSHGFDGEPVISIYGHSLLRIAYDESGNKTRMECCDTAGNLTNSWEGIAVTVWEYTSFGEIAYVCYYDQTGAPAEDSDGIHAILLEYDEEGQMLGYYFLDKNGNVIQDT